MARRSLHKPAYSDWLSSHMSLFDEAFNGVEVPIQDFSIREGTRQALVDAAVLIPAPRAIEEANQHVRELVRLILLVGAGNARGSAGVVGAGCTWTFRPTGTGQG